MPHCGFGLYRSQADKVAMPTNSTNQGVKREDKKKKSLNMDDIVLAFTARHKLSVHLQTRPKVRVCSAVWSKDGPR